LLPYGSNRDAYETRVEEIITTIQGDSQREYYVATLSKLNYYNMAIWDGWIQFGETSDFCQIV